MRVASAPSARIAARSITVPPDRSGRDRRVTAARAVSSSTGGCGGSRVTGSSWVAVIGRLQLGPGVRCGESSVIVAPVVLGRPEAALLCQLVPCGGDFCDAVQRLDALGGTGDRLSQFDPTPRRAVVDVSQLSADNSGLARVRAGGCLPGPFAVGPGRERLAFFDPVQPLLARRDVGMTSAPAVLRIRLASASRGCIAESVEAGGFGSRRGEPAD